MPARVGILNLWFKVVAFRLHQAHPPGLESAPVNTHNSNYEVRNLEVSSQL